jgi:hypothetical protein
MSEQIQESVVQETKGKLNLTPNEIIGYRLYPDQWNWTVVVIKRHGKESKNAGKEYETPLAYCKDLNFAVSWIFNHVSKTESRKAQDEKFVKENLIADLQCVVDSFNKAKEEAISAVEDLKERLSKQGIELSDLKKILTQSEQS